MMAHITPSFPGAICRVWSDTGCCVYAVDPDTSEKEVEFFVEYLVKQIGRDFDISEEELKEKGYL